LFSITNSGARTGTQDKIDVMNNHLTLKKRLRAGLGIAGLSVGLGLWTRTQAQTYEFEYAVAK